MEFIVELLGEIFIEAFMTFFMWLMELIVPEKTFGEKMEKAIRKAIKIFSAILFIMLIIGIILFVQEDEKIKLVGKFLTYIPLAIIIVQIVAGVVMKLTKHFKLKGGGRQMKKRIALILIFVLLCFLGCAKVFDASIFYDTRDTADGFSIVINEKAKCCYAAGYVLTEESARNIVIPEMHSGYPVTQLGGYYGRGVADPFYIALAENQSVVEGGMLENAEIIEVRFNLYISKNISEINGIADLYTLDVNEEGEKIAYHPTVYVICDEENEHFYSENGKLYTKDGTLTEGFAYSENMAE